MLGIWSSMQLQKELSIKMDDIYEDSIRIYGKGQMVRFVPISNPLK